MRYPIPTMTKKLLNSARKTTGKVRKVIIGMNPCRLEFYVSAKGHQKPALFLLSLYFISLSCLLLPRKSMSIAGRREAACKDYSAANPAVYARYDRTKCR